MHWHGFGGVLRVWSVFICYDMGRHFHALVSWHPSNGAINVTLRLSLKYGVSCVRTFSWWHVMMACDIDLEAIDD